MDQKDQFELTAKTVDEAIEIALLELDAERDEVEIDVISKGRTGILGLGSEPARVKVTRITEDTGNAGAGLRLVSRILRIMEVEARPTILNSGSGPEDPPIINVRGEDAGLLIGRKGETLRALHFIVNLLLSKEPGDKKHVVVDVERYRERRAKDLTLLATRTASQVVSSGKPISLEPMSAADRRLIHVALADKSDVSTESSGAGRERKVTVSPSDSHENMDPTEE